MAVENILWSNFDYVDDFTGTGFGFYGETPFFARVLESEPYFYSGTGTETNLPYASISTDAQWLYYAKIKPDNDTTGLSQEIGITTNSSGHYLLNTGVKNYFGLNINSARLSYGGVIMPGVASAYAANGSLVTCHFEAAAPILANTGYYFASQTPFLNYYNTGWSGGSLPGPPPPLPGSPTFSATNTPPLIAGFGIPLTISGWSKYAISNGYSNRFAYLEQYFDKAYTIATNGVATTNLAGVLSPYGEFFPTMPGLAAVVTMPDIDTGQRGTGVVSVIKLQLDVNHDGTMDLSYSGPDNTSWNRPFLFWVNNDFDRAHDIAGSLDEDDLETEKSPYAFGESPSDCEYRNVSGYRAIPSKRDLEDFARLWICGITTNLLASLPSGVTGELSWGDKGNPNTNNPTIDFFGPAYNATYPDRYGSDAYLTNAADAGYQSNVVAGARLAPGGSITVVTNGTSIADRLIWCGVKKGAGQLTFTFRQGSNALASTSAYIEIKDIKEMYERYTVGDDPNIAPTNIPQLAQDGVTVPFQYTPTKNADASYILLVHDYDLPMWKKNRYAETAFKRLYWQSYQGRFGLFRWPGEFNGIVRPLDDSEFNAWRSGVGLLNLLTNLNAKYPGDVYLMAHGYGCVAAGEALRLAGTNDVVNTYVAMQGAVASDCYDNRVPGRIPFPDHGTPNRYLNYYTNTAPSYFWGARGATFAYVNFYSTNDYVLTNRWRSTEDSKPDLGYGFNGTNFYRGVPYFNTPLLFPTDTYEIFAYCDETRCEAIGAQPNLGGPFDVSLQIDLVRPPYSFSGASKDHNAEFLSYCAYRWEFWHAVLNSMGLKP